MPHVSDLPGSRNSALAARTGREQCVLCLLCCVLGLVVTLRCTRLVKLCVCKDGAVNEARSSPFALALPWYQKCPVLTKV